MYACGLNDMSMLVTLPQNKITSALTLKVAGGIFAVSCAFEPGGMRAKRHGLQFPLFEKLAKYNNIHYNNSYAGPYQAPAVNGHKWCVLYGLAAGGRTCMMTRLERWPASSDDRLCSLCVVPMAVSSSMAA